MKSWYFIAVAAVIVVALVYVIYGPAVFSRQEELNGEPSAQDIQPPDPVGGQVLTFASDPWPPYAGTAGAEREGYIVDVLREIYEPLGYRVRYVNHPWTRCIADVRSGRLAGLAGCDVHEAPDLVYPRETIGTTRPTFFALKDARWRYDGVKSLAAIRLGAIQDYTYERNVDVYIRQHRGTDRIVLTTGNDALPQLIQLLRADRIDALIEARPVVEAAIRAINAEDIVIAGEAPGLRLFVPFSPRIPEGRAYARLFDRRIRELRSNGRLAEILAAYELTDWKGHEMKLQDNAGAD